MAYTIRNKFQTARNYLTQYLADVDVSVDAVWNALLMEDQFISEIARQTCRAYVELSVESWAHWLLKRDGLDEYSKSNY